LLAVFIDSQNSPWLVVPSPVDTNTTSSPRNCASARPSVAARTDPSAAPTPCRNCVPVGDEELGMLSPLCPQCEGICRPPELGSAAAPTAE
jgi:PAB1-binding protein PBP1